MLGQLLRLPNTVLNSPVLCCRYSQLALLLHVSVQSTVCGAAAATLSDLGLMVSAERVACCHCPTGSLP